MDDDDATLGRQARLEIIARQAARAELAAADANIRRIADEQIARTWGQVGVDITKMEGVERHRDVLDWARASFDRSKTQNARTMTLLGVGMAVLSFVGGFVKWLWDAQFHGGSGGH